MERTIFFIVADEKTNPAERDSMKAIAAAICIHGDRETSYCCLKIDQPVEHGIAKSCHHGPPIDNETYARIARYDDVYMEQAYGDVMLVGVGPSTSAVLVRAGLALAQNNNVRLVHSALVTLPDAAEHGLSEGFDLAMQRDRFKLQTGFILSP